MNSKRNNQLLLKVIPGTKIVVPSDTVIYKVLTTESQVRDSLGGEITGDYKYDLLLMQKRGYTCQKIVYDEAYQNNIQPYFFCIKRKK